VVVDDSIEEHTFVEVVDTNALVLKQHVLLVAVLISV